MDPIDKRLHALIEKNLHICIKELNDSDSI
jgi:hypothetical protein